MRVKQYNQSGEIVGEEWAKFAPLGGVVVVSGEANRFEGYVAYGWPRGTWFQKRRMELLQQEVDQHA